MLLVHYRIANSFISLLLGITLLSLILFATGCQKTCIQSETPVIEILADSSCISADTSVTMGSNMTFRIKAKGQEVPLTNFVVTYNNGTTSYYLDSGMYCNEIIYELSVTKGASAFEEWTFFVMNKARMTASISLRVVLDSGAVFSPIEQYNITLGAQDNTFFGSFYSFTSDSIYTLEEAFNNQPLIDISYYYHTTYESTLSSPNDNDAPSMFTGTYGIGNWTVRNESRYNLTTLSSFDFNNITNDSLLIASYDIVNAKRKGKNIVPGQVWAFRIASGKLGLIYVEGTETGVSGKVVLKIKIQEQA